MCIRDRHRSTTSFFTFATTCEDFSELTLSNISKIHEPTCFNCVSLKPLVVTAGVPNLIPDVTVGFSISKGIPFLLQTIFPSPSTFSAVAPVTFFFLRSTSRTWVSVPPVTKSRPPSCNVWASVFAFFITCFWYCTNSVSYTHLTLPTILRV